MTLTWTKENTPRWDADARITFVVAPARRGFREASRGQLRRQVITRAGPGSGSR